MRSLDGVADVGASCTEAPGRGSEVGGWGFGSAGNPRRGDLQGQAPLSWRRHACFTHLESLRLSARREGRVRRAQDQLPARAVQLAEAQAQRTDKRVRPYGGTGDHANSNEVAFLGLRSVPGPRTPKLLTSMVD